VSVLSFGAQGAFVGMISGEILLAAVLLHQMTRILKSASHPQPAIVS
jgi:hypothetical protein